MRASFDHLREIFTKSMTAGGDVIEIGVWRGDTLFPMAEAAREFDKLCYGVDSFEGMAAPTIKDYLADGKCEYPKGSLCHSWDDLIPRAVEAGNVPLVRGFVPDVLKSPGLPGRIAFAHVDLDQYLPTSQALEWCWPRISAGGVLACHDWFPRRGVMASAAFDEFVAKHGLSPIGPTVSNHGFLVRS